jgi:hypothetical protein
MKQKGLSYWEDLFIVCPFFGGTELLNKGLNTLSSKNFFYSSTEDFGKIP